MQIDFRECKIRVIMNMNIELKSGVTQEEVLGFLQTMIVGCRNLINGLPRNALDLRSLDTTVSTIKNWGDDDIKKWEDELRSGINRFFKYYLVLQEDFFDGKAFRLSSGEGEIIKGAITEEGDYIDRHIFNRKLLKLQSKKLKEVFRGVGETSKKNDRKIKKGKIVSFSPQQRAVYKLAKQKPLNFHVLWKLIWQDSKDKKMKLKNKRIECKIKQFGAYGEEHINTFVVQQMKGTYATFKRKFLERLEEIFPREVKKLEENLPE